MSRSDIEKVSPSLRHLQTAECSPYFVKAVEWLQSRLQERRIANDKLQDVELSWSQGRAQELQEILEIIADAPAVVAKLQQNKGR